MAGVCNTNQNEIGGKELLLKVCKSVKVATTNASDTLTLSALPGETLPKFKVGDVVAFDSVGAITVIDPHTQAAPKFYKVVAVPTASTIKISELTNSTPLVMDATEAALDALVFVNFGGLRSKTFSFKTDGIDITNADSDEWKTMLDGAGIRSFDVSGEGVYTNSQSFQDAFKACRENKLICLMFIEVKTQSLFEGCFKITSMELSGAYDGEGTYSMSASSSGALTVVLNN